MDFRKDFPILNTKTIYFDNAATSLKPLQVIEEIDKYYKDYPANSHRGDYTIAGIVDDKILETRENIRDFINAEKSSEIVFTSGATEGLNTIIKGFFTNYLKTGDEILTTKAEHASLILPIFDIIKKNAAVVNYIELNDDLTVTIENVKRAITKKTKAIFLAGTTNVLGDERPIKEICDLAHKLGILVVVDGAQMVPHKKVDVQDLDVDFMVFSAHKMLGPTGIGVLYGKEKYLKNVKPLIEGGGMNASFDSLGNVEYKELPEKLEAGTINLSGILGFNEAINYLRKLNMDDVHKYEVDLKKYLVEKLDKLSNVTIYNKNIENGIVTFNVDNVFAQDVAIYLNKKNICVRVGNHCAKILNEVLGVKNTIRVSLYFYNTKDEVDKLVEALENKNILYDSL